jgi:hypothetical protein
VESGYTRNRRGKRASSTWPDVEAGGPKRRKRRRKRVPRVETMDTVVGPAVLLTNWESFRLRHGFKIRRKLPESVEAVVVVHPPRRP